ncbi:non-ribosomal peptide synthetase, partial [Rhodococcus opacus M213]
PLSLAQQRMWFINQYDTTSPAYNIPLAVRLRGPLDTTALTDALTDVITRHETLRTHYPDSDDGPHQVVHDPSSLELIGTVIDENELGEQLARFVTAGFDVAAEIPLRVALFGIRSTDHVLALVVHHICADGSSLKPLAHDLMTAYEARVSGRAPTWTPLPVQYGDYTLWQRETLGSEDDPESIISQQIRYWTHTLTNLPEVLELPTDHPRPPQQTLHGAAIDFTIDKHTHHALTELAHREHTTVFMVCHAALTILLARLTNTTDITIGTPIAGRTHPHLDNLIGMFVGTLVLRNTIAPTQTFTNLLHHVRDTDIAAFAHADLPFERLVELLNPPRSTAHAPLTQV